MSWLTGVRFEVPLQPRASSLGHWAAHTRVSALRHPSRNSRAATVHLDHCIRTEPDSISSHCAAGAHHSRNRLDQSTDQGGALISKMVECLTRPDGFQSASIRRRSSRTHRKSEFSANTSTEVDDAMGRLDSELQGELPSSDCHGDILSAGPEDWLNGCPLLLGNPSLDKKRTAIIEQSTSICAG